MTGFVIAAACNSERILTANLARSPLLRQVELHAEWGAASAAAAYNRAIAATTEPVIVFAHQDVFLPKGWDHLLAARIAEVSAIDPQWALLGAFGVGLDGTHHGPVWSSSLGQIVGRVSMMPQPVQSYDEMLIVLRRGSGLRFDETIPGWHMYGTDIVTQARTRGLHAYAGALPTIHNDRYHEVLGTDFDAAYHYLQTKWRDRLPLRSPIVKISRSGLHLLKNRWQNRRSAGFRAGMAIGTATPPETLTALCGWSDLAACA